MDFPIASSAAANRLRRLASHFALLALVASPRIAQADVSAADRNLAQSLFDQARELLSVGKFSEACPKLAESQRLDPGGGTLLNLAICHEKEGKTATAWGEFNEALSVARRDGRSERERLARDHITMLGPSLARVTIAVAGDKGDLQVALDGATQGKASWGTSTPVDPGEHQVTASASGKRNWSTSFRLVPSEKKTIQIPQLADADSAPVSRPSEKQGATSKKDEPRMVSAGATTGADDVGSSSGKKTIGLVVGGAGIVAIGVGAVFGLTALSKKKESDEQCVFACSTAAPKYSAPGVDSYDQAKSAAHIANIAIGVGIAATAAGVFLVLTSGGSRSSPTAARSLEVVPEVGRSSAGLSLGGSF